LLRWFAFWAAGWAISIKRYKEKIKSLLLRIYAAYTRTLPCNRPYVGDYLDSYAYQSLDLLLRSTQPQVHGDDSTDGKLRELVDDFDKRQEDRLSANLKEVKFDISSLDKVTLVTGSGRIERVRLSTFP